jgi:hypothetical protein
MGFLSTLLTGGDSVKAITEVVDKLFTSDEERAAAKLEIMKAEQTYKLELAKMDTSLALGQIEVNKVEASSSDRFVAGWRPAVGWICALAILYAFFLEPFFRFTAQVIFAYSGQFPEINTSDLNSLLFGMLGLGGLRTYEKLKGIA